MVGEKGREMIPARVLILSDDAETGNFWRYGLTQRGITALLIEPTPDFIDIVLDQHFELFLIDLNNDVLKTRRIIEELRSEVTVPLLVLMSAQSESVILDMYAAGVDECVLKPIGPKLLVAKIAAWLNRSGAIPVSILDSLHVGNVRLDPALRQFVNEQGTAIKLTNLEFRLLHLLMSHPGQILDTNTIIERVWSYDDGENTALLKNMIYRLRRKIEPEPGEPRYIISVAGEGYLFQP